MSCLPYFLQCWSSELSFLQHFILSFRGHWHVQSLLWVLNASAGLLPIIASLIQLWWESPGSGDGGGEGSNRCQVNPKGTKRPLRLPPPLIGEGLPTQNNRSENDVEGELGLLCGIHQGSVLMTGRRGNRWEREVRLRRGMKRREVRDISDGDK